MSSLPAPIYTAKEWAQAPRPIYLCNFTWTDGSGAPNLYLASVNVLYGGNQYMGRVTNEDIPAIQGQSSAGASIIPSVTITLNDADGYLWENVETPYGFGGATMTMVLVQWDPSSNQFSTNSLGAFIGVCSSPKSVGKTLTIYCVSAMNFENKFDPQIHIQPRCPWVFPGNYAQRAASLNGASVSYQCGYSPDVDAGAGVGVSPAHGNFAGTATISAATLGTGTLAVTVSSTANMAVLSELALSSMGGLTGANKTWVITSIVGSVVTLSVSGVFGTYTSGGVASIPYETCTYIVQDCQAKGNFTFDYKNQITGRFGGIQYQPPLAWASKSYTTGKEVYGYNAANQAIYSQYIPEVAGAQMLTSCPVTYISGDGNSTHMIVLVAWAFLGVNAGIENAIPLVIVNDVVVANAAFGGQNLLGGLFWWQMLNPGDASSNPAYNGNPFLGTNNNPGFAPYGQGDPYGSYAALFLCVPIELTSSEAIPTVQVLVAVVFIAFPQPAYISAATNASPIVLTVNSTTGMATGDPAVVAGVVGNTAANGAWTITVIDGTHVSLNGSTGNGAFVATGDETIVDCNSSYAPWSQAQTFSPAWLLMDRLVKNGVPYGQLDLTTFALVDAIASVQVAYTDLTGNTAAQHNRYICGYAITAKQPAAETIQCLLNSFNGYMIQSPTTGFFQIYCRQTLADQQGAIVAGSNSTTPIASVTALDVAANGYSAYDFTEGEYDQDSLQIISQSLDQLKNTIVISFQDQDNQFQQDSLTMSDVEAVNLVGRQYQYTLPVLGLINFDQCSRIANVFLAESLRGNPRNDPKGSIIIRFTASQRVVHMRMGHIFRLTNQKRGWNLQQFRVLSMQPDTDAQNWTIEARWHEDEWYTDAYGQNPAPFYSSGGSALPVRPPYPWQPANLLEAGGTLFGEIWTFALTQQYASNADGTATAQVALPGYRPINVMSQTAQPPLMPLQGTATTTGGSFAAGTYYIGACGMDASGLLTAMSKLTTCVVPSGTTGTISAAIPYWPPNNVGCFVFVGIDQMNILSTPANNNGVPFGAHAVSGATNASPIVLAVSTAGITTGQQCFVMNAVGNTAANGLWTVTVINSLSLSLNGSTGNGTLVPGNCVLLPPNPSSVTLTTGLTFPNLANSFAPPDVLFDHFQVNAKVAPYLGCWEATIVVTGTYTIQVTGATWTTNQWANRWISLVGRTAGSIQILADVQIVSNTASVLTFGSAVNSIFQNGDIIALRSQPTAVTSTSYTDTGLVNNTPATFTINGVNYPGGLPAGLPSVVGFLARVVGGAGGGQPPATIIANTADSVTIGAPWVVQPDSTSVIIIEEPNWIVQQQTAPLVNSAVPQFGNGTAPIVATLNLPNISGQNLFIQVLTVDRLGNTCVAGYAPTRDTFLLGARGSLLQSKISLGVAVTYTPDLSVATSFEITLALTRCTIENPINVGSIIQMKIYLIQPSGGGCPSPAWGTAYGPDVTALIVPEDQNTCTTIQLALRTDGLWHLDFATQGQST